MSKKLPQNLKPLEIFIIIIISFCSTVIIARYANVDSSEYVVLFLVLLFVTYYMFWLILTEPGKRHMEEYEKKQEEKAILNAKSKKLQKSTYNYPYEPSSIPKINSEIESIKQQIQIARQSGENELEKKLKERKKQLTAQIQQIQIFIMKQGFH